MAQVGYKPGSLARGVGTVGSGQARVTSIGAFASATWITAVGIRAGRTAAQAGWGRAVFYLKHPTATSPHAKLYESATFHFNTFMASNDRATGINYEQTGITGVLAPGGQIIYGGPWNDGPGVVSYGQDNSGDRMFYHNGHFVPDPFNEHTSSPQGEVDCWMIGVANRAPDMPQIVAPAANEAVVDTTPTFRARFRDPDIVHGDELTAFKFELWNATNTARLADDYQSGVQDATTDMRESGIAEWAPPEELAPDTYTVRCNLYDRALEASPTLMWTFSVNAGGAFTGVQMVAADQAGSAGGNVVTNATAPRFQALWSHDSDEPTASVRARIRNADSGAVYRVEKSGALEIADGGLATIDFDDLGTAWAAMARGATRFVFEIGATDDLGGITGWASSPPFVVNAAPVIASPSPAAGHATTTRPELSVIVTDGTDAAGSHAVAFTVSQGGVDRTIAGQHVGGGRYRARLTATQLPALGSYTWSAEATDPWGLETALAARALHYVAPPAFSNVSPASGGTIGTGTPVIEADVDRTITHQRVTIVIAGTQTPIWDSEIRTASGAAVALQVPPATLPNKLAFTATIWVRAADGLEATTSTTFSLEYESPPLMTGTTATTVPSSIFDGPTHFWPAQEPNVRLTWPIIGEAVVPRADWRHYVIYRVAAGETRKWLISDQTQGAWVDTSAPPGVELRYYLGYERWMNEGLDSVESVLVKHTLSVTLLHTTITSESASDPAVTLHLWQDRGASLTPDIAFVPILGQEDDDAWMSNRRVREFTGKFEVLDDSALHAYTARDIVARVEELMEAVRDRNGKTVPRTLWWRDPKRPPFRIVLTNLSTPDHHEADRATIDLRARKVYSGERYAEAVNDEEAVPVITYGFGLTPFGRGPFGRGQSSP